MPCEPQLFYPTFLRAPPKKTYIYSPILTFEIFNSFAICISNQKKFLLVTDFQDIWIFGDILHEVQFFSSSPSGQSSSWSHHHWLGTHLPLLHVWWSAGQVVSAKIHKKKSLWQENCQDYVHKKTNRNIRLTEKITNHTDCSFILLICLFICLFFTPYSRGAQGELLTIPYITRDQRKPRNHLLVDSYFLYSCLHHLRRDSRTLRHIATRGLYTGYFRTRTSRHSRGLLQHTNEHVRKQLSKTRIHTVFGLKFCIYSCDTFGLHQNLLLFFFLIKNPWHWHEKYCFRTFAHLWKGT